MRCKRFRAVILVACAALPIGARADSARPPLLPDALAPSSLGIPWYSLTPGDETCDAAIDAGTIPPDFVEASVFLDPGDRDWRVFRVETPRAVSIATVGDALRADTNLVLVQGCADGAPTLVLAFSEDRAIDDYTSRIPATGGRCLAPGTYFVFIGSWLLLGTELPFDLRIEDEGPCTLPPRDRFEPDDTFATARRIGVGTPSVRSAPAAPRGVPTRTIFPITDFDYARFELAEPAMVRVRASSPTGGDPVLGVGRATDGTFIAVTDNESASSFAARFESCLPAGSWFAAVAARFVPDTFTYDLTVEKSSRCDFEREPNNTWTRATALPIRGSRGILWGVQDTRDGVFDVDVYRLVVPSTRGVVLETGGYDSTDVDTRIELLDARGGLIASDDDGGNVFCSRIERVLPAGTYHVAVSSSPFEGPVGDTWVYSLSATLSAPPPVEVEPNDLCAQAGPFRPGGHLLAALEPVGDRDHFLMNLGPSSMGGFEVEIVIRSTGDPVLDMFQDPGECASRAACDDDSSEGLDPLIRCCFAGDAAYTLRVREYRDDNALPAYSIQAKILGECTPLSGCQVAPNQFGCDGSD